MANPASEYPNGLDEGVRTLKIDQYDRKESPTYGKLGSVTGRQEVDAFISGSPSGTQDVNIAKVGGNAVTTTVPVSGSVTTGGLTDIQLRAAPVPISGTVSTGAVTDTQLRATPVPVSGTVNPTSPSVLLAFVTTVTTAGTRVQLASHSAVGGIIQAPSTNSGLIYIGDSTVSSSVYGSELQPGQSAGVSINNTNTIWIDSSVNGNKCAFLGS